MKVKKRLLCLAVAFSYALVPALVSAKDYYTNKYYLYGEEGILYYDPDWKDGDKSEGEENPCDDSVVIISGNNASSIFSSLVSAGFSKTAAAAFLGNLEAESGLEPRKLQGGSLVNEDFRLYNGTIRQTTKGFGLAQWTDKARQKNLQDYADSHGLKVASLEAQIGFLLSEATGSYAGSVAPSILNSMSLEDAVFQIARYYEKPAKMIYKTYNQYIPDRRSQLSPSNTAGAYEEYTNRFNNARKYVGLTPSGSSSSGSSCEQLPGSGDQTGGGNQSLKSGGMTLAGAKNFMQTYRNLASSKSSASIATPGKPTIYSAAGCKDGTFNNCSAFSAWFVNNYTSAGTTNYSGDQFVSKLLASNQGFIDGHGIPKVYAVMSYTISSQKHTGIVLGIDTERDKIIIGEASCHNGFNNKYPGANEYSLSAYINHHHVYAYTDRILKGNL